MLPACRKKRREVKLIPSVKFDLSLNAQGLLLMNNYYTVAFQCYPFIIFFGGGGVVKLISSCTSGRWFRLHY